eukprot:m.9804 g.9804  ORF g.9804 m.9804 type:complete len:100 (+) comp4136_c0_seq1:234-533(+)
MALKLVLEFSGGTELLIKENKKKALVELPNDQEWNLKRLIEWIGENLVSGPKEMFAVDGGVRPGILVLVNDTDWELLDELNYVLEEDDHVLFISTLHGG